MASNAASIRVTRVTTRRSCARRAVSPLRGGSSGRRNKRGSDRAGRRAFATRRQAQDDVATVRCPPPAAIEADRPARFQAEGNRPGQGIDWRSFTRRGGFCDARDQRFASIGIAGQSRQLPHLRHAVLYARDAADRLDPDTEIGQRRSRGGPNEAARDHHVRIERQHLLHRATGRAIAARVIGLHRAGARILAVMRDRQQLSRRRHLRKDRVGAGVQADDTGAIAIRRSGRRCRRRASAQRQHRSGQPADHIRVLTPTKAPRPAWA